MSKRISLRLRVALLAACLAVLPIVAVGFMTYLFAERTLVDETKRMSQVTMHQVQTQMEDMLADISRVVLQAMTRDDLNILFHQGELLQHVYETDNVMAMLASIESLVEHVEDVYLYLPAEDVVITANGTTAQKEELLEEGLIQEMNDNLAPEFWYEHLSPDADADQWTGAARQLEGFSYIRRVPAVSRQPLGYFIVSVNEEALFRIFRHTELGESGGMLLATEAGNLYPGPNTEEWLSHPGFLKQLEAALQGQVDPGNGLETVKLNGERYLLGGMASPRNGLQYISLIPYAQLTAHIGVIRSWLIGLCSLLAALLLLALLRLSGSIYDRIASRWSDMERVRSSLAHRLQSSLPDLTAHYLRQWLTGRVPADGLHRLAQEGADLRGEAYLGICMEWNDASRYGGSETQRFMEDMLACGDRAASMHASCALHAVRMGGDLIGGVIVQREAAAQELEGLSTIGLSIARQWLEGIREELQQVVTIGIGTVVVKEAEVHTSYEAAMSALQQRLLEGGGQVYDGQAGGNGRNGGNGLTGSRKDEARAGGYPYEIEREIVLQLKLGQLPEAGRSLQSFTDALLRRDSVSHEDVLQAFAMLHASIYRIPAESLRMSSFAALSGGEVSNIYRFKTVRDIASWFHDELFPLIIESIQVERITAAKSSAVMHEGFSAEEAKRYIHTHYNEDLSLQLVAERFGMSEVPFGQAFKREVGVAFSDYLLACRMEKGKQLLLETDMKVADIAEHLRYNNSQNFIRIFKRTTGMTPGQFRKGG
ncbi:AraC family transcriptional regulator [Paenibacillus sp. J5C_2022]|uniref:AraC family transcriptional regulator n=1 Tax=Paenibacillus sp. J5C2022 TaxID=2977129 RepID=UPI0021D28EE6|nr:AraC family transcriptional regulator [Paenibacillus sp. J5C2022]MCU6710223.1 AraC family transcriptional regulator [Paenibacillus sp. J5C2022]